MTNKLVVGYLLIFLLSIVPTQEQEQVHIDTSTPLTEVDERFLGSGWEMWDYLGNIQNIKNTVFTKIVSHLGPGFLRVGGITADFVNYTTGNIKIQNKKRNIQEFWPDYEEVISLDDFMALINFAKETDLELLFDLNEIHGRNCHVNGSHCVGNWDTSNVRSFLTYLHNQKIGPIFGFELGNELTKSQHITSDENIQDYITLGKIITEIWPDATTRPPLYGPSTDICNSDSTNFMQATKSFLGGFTYHSYPGQNGDKLKEQLVDINWLKTIITNDLHANSSYCIQVWKQVGQPVGMKLWVTETSSSYNGIPGVMNAFENGFWYLASLGQYAKTGVARHGRWSLHGGDEFTFVNTTSGHGISVVSDYWIAVLYKHTVGGKVLSTTGDFSTTLVYAHCGKTSGSVTIIVINPHNSDVTLSISGISSVVPREEYIFTAELQSYVVNLNGRALYINTDGSLPDLSPHNVTSGDIVLPKYSYGYIVFPQAASKACS